MNRSAGGREAAGITEKHSTDMPDEEKSSRQGRQTRICIGAAAALLCMLLGAWGLQSLMKPQDSGKYRQEASVAFLDVRKAVEAHPEMEKLQELQQNESLLREEMKEALRYRPFAANVPEVDEKPFQDAVWQKNAQNIIGAAAEIMRDKKQAAAEYRERTEEAYRQKRDELDGNYLNELLNIQLKLQNSDNLQLTEEQINELLSRREVLQKMRGERQMELAKQWEQEITAYAEEAVRERSEKLREQARVSKVALEDDAVAQQAEAQARNAAAMERALQDAAERQQNRLRVMEELQQAIQERTELENRILNDIAGQAARLAILHHYTMILANPAFTLQGRIPWQKWEGEAPEKYAKVIGPGIKDLTDELTEELQKFR